VTSREQAREAVAAGRVLVGGAVADKVSRMVAPGEPVELAGPGPRFVGRGGEKLAAALQRFEIPVAGAAAVDVGASTGGFTDCLLQAGAARVVAVDVGHGQLDQRLRADPRVLVLERTNVRHLTLAGVEARGGPGWVPAGVVVADVSFISLSTVASVLVTLAEPAGHLVVLVKPQFEAGRADAARGRGVIREPGLWRAALDRAARALDAAGTAIMDAMPSPLTGPAGNREFFLWAIAGQRAAVPDPAALLDAAVAAARAEP